MLNQPRACRLHRLSRELLWVTNYNRLSSQFGVPAIYKNVKPLCRSLVKSPIFEAALYSDTSNLLSRPDQASGFSILC